MDPNDIEKPDDLDMSRVIKQKNLTLVGADEVFENQWDRFLENIKELR